MARGILVKHNGGCIPDVSAFELAEDTLHQMYDLIGCDLVDYCQIEFEGKRYDLWFDEEFLVKRNYITFPLCNNGVICGYIAGNIVIMASDKNGECVGLPDDVIAKMISSKFFEKKAIEASEYIAKKRNK